MAALLTGAMTGAQGGAAEDVKSAAAKLAEKANYSWTQTTETGGQWQIGPTHGKTVKDGLTHIKMNWGDTETEVALKGEGGAMNTDSGWQSFADVAEGEDRRLGFVAGMFRDYKTPAVAAAEMAGNTKELAKTGEVIAGELTGEGAAALMRFGGRRDGGPEIRNAKGSAKFWIQDGVLTKYEYSVQGTMNWNGEDRDLDRTVTVEIKDIGTTKVELPDSAKDKLS
jgi:hypothetical protein